MEVKKEVVLPTVSNTKERSIYLIVACTKDGIIGCENKIPWKSLKDFTFFKNMTIHPDETKTNCLLMGSKTLKSLEGRKLVKRKILQLSKTEIETENCFSSIKSAIKHWQEKENGDLWICGGASIYDESISLAIPKEIFVTWIDSNHTIKGDRSININLLLNEKSYKESFRSEKITEQKTPQDEPLYLEFCKYTLV